MLTSTKIQLSIIIPTFGRNQILWDSLLPLLKQVGNNDEIIIIDQNTPPLTLPHNIDTKFVTVYHQKRPSLTKARNLGIKYSLGSHILFLDDDIYPDSKILHHLKEAIIKYPGKIIAGAVEQKETPAVQGIGFINLKTGEIKTNYASHQESFVQMFAGCHFLLPRTCLLPYPGFCPIFKGSSQGEEIDYALRLQKNGIHIVFYPKARLFHRKESEGGCRSLPFKNNFYLHHCFNEGLFYGRNGDLFYIRTFFNRLKGFIEFHCRREDHGYDIKNLLTGFYMVTSELLRGLLSKQLL